MRDGDSVQKPGKSTLLKMLNGLIKPDHGKITMKGRIGALIELNAGFNPILTGRENVYIYGSILGFTKKEIDEKYDDIVAFAELEEFMEMPFRSYSSGMKVRLGFAVAAQMEPDVLIVDEVLAVGDIGFKAKCLNVMARLIRKCAVIFVSHNMANMAKMSTYILLLKSGQTVYHGIDTSKGIVQYFDQFYFGEGVRIGEDKILLKRCSVSGKNSGDGVVTYANDLLIDIEFIFLKECHTDVLMLTFVDQEAKNVAVTYLELPETLQGDSEVNNLTVKVPGSPFSAGVFSVTITFAESIKGCLNGSIVAQYHSAVSFKATDSRVITNIPVQLQSELITN